jgi:hypothetical protein
MTAGQPTELTQRVTATMVEQIRRGVVVETAAEAAGIRQATFHDWMARGGRGEEPFAEFVARCGRPAHRRASPASSGYGSTTH